MQKKANKIKKLIYNKNYKNINIVVSFYMNKTLKKC